MENLQQKVNMILINFANGKIIEN